MSCCEYGEEVHPGAGSLPDVPRAKQIRLFGAALDHSEAADPPLDMVNTDPMVHESGEVAAIPIP